MIPAECTLSCARCRRGRSGGKEGGETAGVDAADTLTGVQNGAASCRFPAGALSIVQWRTLAADSVRTPVIFDYPPFLPSLPHISTLATPPPTLFKACEQLFAIAG